MFVEPNNILFTDKGKGITQRMLGYHSQLMAVEMTFQKGSSMPPHSHADHVQGIYIVKGSFMCYADKGEIHGTYCLEDQSILLDIHSPMRADILEEGLNYNSQKR